MMRFWRCLRFVWFVHRQIKKDEAFGLESYLITSFQQEKHKWWFWNFNGKEIRRIIKYARNEDKAFLGAYQGAGGVKLKVTPKGDDLLDFPLGTLQKFMEQYSRGVSAVVLIVGSALAVSPFVTKIVHYFTK